VTVSWSTFDGYATNVIEHHAANARVPRKRSARVGCQGQQRRVSLSLRIGERRARETLGRRSVRRPTTVHRNDRAGQ